MTISLSAWPKTKVKNLAEYITVGFVGSMSHLFCDDGVPLLRGQNIKPYSLDLSNLKFISLETHRKWKKSALLPGDVAIVRVGYPGTASVIPEGAGEMNAASLVIVRPDKKLLDAKFLCYVINSPWGKSQVLGRLVGSAQQVFNTQTAADLEIPAPPLPTQRKIAGILSAYDDLIENNLRRIKILEQMAQSLYREWFVHFRFPGHESATFKDSQLGRIPEGWEVRKLETLYRTSSGGTPSRKNLEYYEEGTIDWVKTGELKDCFVLSSEEKITAQALSKSSAKLFPANTVLIALYGATIGQLGILSREAATNQACCAILEVGQPFGRAFAYLTLLLRRNDIIGLRLGAAQQNISQAVLRDFEVICPPAPLLDAFNQRSEPMFDLLLNLQSRNHTLRRTRDLLLQTVMRQN
jgi:type I restriction enzyme S subunit